MESSSLDKDLTNGNLTGHPSRFATRNRIISAQGNPFDATNLLNNRSMRRKVMQ